MGTQHSLHQLDPLLAASPSPLGSTPESPARPVAPKARLDVLRHFDAVFSEAPAITRAEIEEAFRLRYQVYCLERGFEEAESRPDGLERDCYDDGALHSLLRVRLGRCPIGTVRLVRPDPAPIWVQTLPLAEYAHEESLEILSSLPPEGTAEVSRFAIARTAREILQLAQAVAAEQQDARCRRPERYEMLLPYMSLGLIRGLVRLSMAHGVTHWCLAAEPSLLRRLRGFGLHFHNAGPLVDHRGLRQVCFAELSELLARAEAERPEFWDVITVGGFLLSDQLSRSAA
jgi:N-acyl amino acid synthase of PEP-CTERM/exosortase system